MTILALISLFLGIFCGLLLFNEQTIVLFDNLSFFMLILVVFTVGIDIGNNKTVFKRLKKYNIKILLIPLATILGSISSAIILGMFLNMDFSVSGAIGSGLGFYSLAPSIIKDSFGETAATISFLSNIFREVLSIIFIPLISKYLGGYSALSSSGACSMDTTLPIILKYNNEQVAFISVIHGIICTIAVPILVEIFIQIKI